MSEADDRPYEKLVESATALVRDEMSWIRDEVPGDSPIEKVMATALEIVGRFGCREHRGIRFVNNEAELKEWMDRGGIELNNLLGESQKQIEGWRVDFLIHAYEWKTEKWRGLIVECDGHDFHERTKAQARKDRSRDRAVQHRGKYQVFRFTGSEIWADPWGCAGEVYSWAASHL